jgi:hypothetical protein
MIKIHFDRGPGFGFAIAYLTFLLFEPTEASAGMQPRRSYLVQTNYSPIDTFACQGGRIHDYHATAS